MVTPDAGCANFGSYWTLGSGVDVPVTALEGLTNCRLSDAGEWFVPDGEEDPQLSDRSRLTAKEEALVDSMRSYLIDDLAALEAQLPRSLKEALEANYVDENLPVFGHTSRVSTKPTFSVKHARYQRITQAFLLSPSRVELAVYVGWVMERRSTAVGQFEAACVADPDTEYLLRACAGMRREFGVSSIPIYWELTDPVLIEEYLAWSARSDRSLPTAPPTVTIE